MNSQVVGYRLSPQQRRLWRLSGQSHVQRAQCAVKLEGDLDESALERALRLVADRHEILRTSFQRRPGSRNPMQVIEEIAGPELRRVDLSGASCAEQEARVEELFRREAGRPFDLARVPLFRATLLGLGPRRRVLLLGLPALCADAATLRILVREVCAAYRAAARGESLPEAPVQYADLAEWQNEFFESEEGALGRDYWRGRGLCDPHALKLPFELKPADGADFDPQFVSSSLAPELFERIRSHAGRRGAAPSSFVLAGWQVLVGRLTGHDRVLIGVASDGRKYEEVSDAPGPFAKLLPVETSLGPGVGFGEAVIRAREAECEARQWEEWFADDFIDWSDGRDERGRFFPLCFEAAEVSTDCSASGVSFALYKQYTCADRFKLKLSFVEAEGAASIELHYDSNLFRREDVETLSAQLVALLASAAENPEAAVGELDALGPAERAQLLGELNDTRADYPRRRCVHELIEEQARRTPEAAALDFDGLRVTYAELDRRANRLARHLRKLGVGPETRVGLYLGRSPELVVGLLAVLKAGGAYVPLDPDYPRQRVEFILGDASAEVILTVGRLSEELPDGRWKVVRLDADRELFERESGRRLSNVAAPVNLAYVIYTSGSTGKPKGTMVPHSGLVNYLSWAAAAYRTAEGAGSPVHSSVGFDLTLTSLFTPLLAGRCAYLLPEEGAVEALASALETRAGFSLVKITPAHLEALSYSLAGGPRAGQTAALIIGGEALFGESLAPWRDAAPGTRVVNEYGPTETVVGCCTYEFPAATARPGPVPIGRPIANTRIYLLDERGRPVPTWATGEIYIGGDGVARGYLKRPALTAERFVPDPFSTEPGARLYRTGDLARFLPGGDIEYLGRADHQLKIRGFRVEPGEIEAALSGHPRVREAVVLASRDRGGLTAYLTAADGLAPAATELRAFLKERLPEYMIPGAFIFVEAMPLTAHGKIDRDALEALGVSAPTRDEADRAYRTPVEEMLAAIWSETLGVGRARPADNFLESGGHSLLALRLTSRLRDVFDVELNLDDVLGAATLADLARKIEESMGGAAAATARIEPAPRDEPLPLSFAQQRLWILDQLSPGSPTYNVPLAVRLTGAFDAQVFGRALSEVVRRHESLRTTFAVADEQPVQVVHPPRPLALGVTDLAALPAAEREARAVEIAREEARLPFDLGRGPLLRAKLLRLAEDEHVLLLTMHHIVSDGWSVGVLMRELSALYESFRAGAQSPLAELPVQYADFARWQRRWLGGELLESQLAFWREELAGDLPLLQLPTDRPRPTVQTYNGAARSALLPARLSEAVKALSRTEGVTLFMTLLAAFQVLLHRYTGQTDILVGAPVANRRRSELEGLIGFFVNTLVLRTEVSGRETFRELLGRVREKALRAYAHQDIPFEKLVEELQPQRSLSHTPLFQQMFVLENEPRQEAGPAGLTLRTLEAGSGTAKYDLTLSVEEGERGLSATFEYNTDLFDAETVARMLDHFETLLEAIVADPNARVSRLPLLTAVERRQLLIEWNETDEARPARPCIHHLFEEQAARTPEATALVAGRERLTYRELNERAELIARYLRREGVGPESLVGVLMGRSAQLVVSLLGVLKAGGAYVPLDPSYPRERLSFMLEDSGASLLLTEEALRDSLPEQATRVVRVDAQWDEIARAAGDKATAEVVTGVTARNLAYLIYTSGSTGMPKGVAIEHGSAAVLLAWAGGVFTDEECAGVLFSTSVCFDLSVFELFVPLTCGGQVILAENALQLPELAAAEEVTLVNTVPSAMAELLRMGGLPRSVRTVNLAGEALQNRLVQAIYAQPHVERVYNLYGPSEDTTYSTFALMRRGGEYLPPIGRPVACTRVYLLDAELQPVPAGVAGELYLGGAGLARGYLKRPALTAERFIPDSFSTEPGSRLYRTGDLARYLPDGTIEYLGRADQQIKLRGFRIELGEIEAVLHSHPDVKEAVVVADKDAQGDARLVAYVVAQPGAKASVAEARAFMQEKLPHYMIPSAFVLLDALPLNSNGKVDRKALPALEESNLMPGRRPYAAPRTHVEKELASVWRELLGVERVGVEDNFFELGGHSLTLTQLSSRIRANFQTDVPLVRLFDSPTLASMAEAVTDSLVEQQGEGELDELLDELKDLSPEEVKMLLEGGA